MLLSLSLAILFPEGWLCAMMMPDAFGNTSFPDHVLPDKIDHQKTESITCCLAM
jgi:hypothetical protein